jgi:hypothetical protein
MNARTVPWWGTVPSAAPPVLLAAGWTIAAFLQPRPYDPVADTVSVLAGTGATDRWVMTLAFALAGGCEIVTGLALRPARTAGRLVLAAGGTAGVLVAEFPVHMGDGAPGSHVLWATVGLVALAAWPVAASRRGPAVPWPLRLEVSALVAVILVALLTWFGLELVTSAGQAGLAERVLGEAQSAWPFAVVMSCRHPVAMTVRYRPFRGKNARGSRRKLVGRCGLPGYREAQPCPDPWQVIADRVDLAAVLQRPDDHVLDDIGDRRRRRSAARASAGLNEQGAACPAFMAGSEPVAWHDEGLHRARVHRG